MTSIPLQATVYWWGVLFTVRRPSRSQSSRGCWQWWRLWVRAWSTPTTTTASGAWGQPSWCSRSSTLTTGRRKCRGRVGVVIPATLLWWVAALMWASLGLKVILLGHGVQWWSSMLNSWMWSHENFFECISWFETRCFHLHSPDGSSYAATRATWRSVQETFSQWSARE